MPGASDARNSEVFRYELACDLAQVPAAVQAVHRFLGEQSCSEADLMDCELALVEACNNAIQNATPESRDLPVEIEIVCKAREIEMRVADHTPGFDWPQRAHLPAPNQERGRGIYLIQAVMDKAHYTRSRAKNVLVLRKRRV